MSDPLVHKEASENPYYKVNPQKKIICRLCNAMCRDDANFLTHLQGKPHRTNLEKAERRKRLASLREQRNLAERAGAAGGGGEYGGYGPNGALSATTVVAPYGEPEYNTRIVPNPEIQCTKVWIEAYYPKASDDMRPMHRWVNTYEQTQEPEQKGIIYLLLACEGYTTIALKFPSEFPRTNDRDAAEGKYECRWDATRKVFNLFFMIG